MEGFLLNTGPLNTSGQTFDAVKLLKGNLCFGSTLESEALEESSGDATTAKLVT